MTDIQEEPAQEPSLAERLGQACVALRPDLEVSRHIFRGEVCYIFIDPLTFSSHRFARADYAILTRIRDSVPLSVIFEELVSVGDLLQDSEERFYGFVFSLHKSGLLNLPISDEKSLYERHLSKKKGKRSQSIKSLLFFKIPMLDPDALLTRTARYAAPFFGRGAFAAWLALVALALWVVGRNWMEFTEPVGDIFRNENLPLLWISLITLKIAHEFGHGYATKLRGGHVPEMGLFMMIFTPCAYVDSTAAWGFPRKRDRMVVNFAGMYIEIYIAVISVLLWSITPPGMLRSVLHNIIMLSSVITIGFNVNPLMRFDGYYALSDWMEIPNLRARSQAEGTRLLKRIVLGLHTPGEAKLGLRCFLVFFGICSAIYKFTLVIGISATIAMKFPAIGLGIGLAYLLGEALGVLRVCIPYLWGHHETASVRGWAVTLLALLLVGMPLGIALVPVPNSVVTKGVLSSEIDLVLRATTDGFLAGIHVNTGEELSAGQPIVVLEDAESTSALAEVEGRLEAAQVQLDRAANVGVATRTQESYRVKQLEVERDMLAEQVSRLQILAPVDARVIELIRPGEVGRFVSQGEPIASLASGYTVVRALMSEEQLVASGARPGSLAEFRATADRSKVWQGIVGRILPAGKRELNQSFAASLDPAEYGVNPLTGLAPRSQFEVEIRLLGGAEVDTLPRGLTGHLRFLGEPEPLGLAIIRKSLTFLRRLTS
ncbi:MAG: putative peptide zinc metalloprotease protein [Planctomycetota bacterium]|jgi:putative peptide zinc metalloprotease protein